MTAEHREARLKRLREMRERVDELVIAGRTTRFIVAAVGVDNGFIRERRKALIEAGRLFYGAQIEGSLR